MVGPQLQHRVKIRVVEWDDAAFLTAVNEAVRRATDERAELDACVTAARVQHELRATGYAAAVIAYWRSAEEALHQTAHWTVWRDGLPDNSARRVLPTQRRVTLGD